MCNCLSDNLYTQTGSPVNKKPGMFSSVLSDATCPAPTANTVTGILSTLPNVLSTVGEAATPVNQTAIPLLITANSSPGNLKTQNTSKLNFSQFINKYKWWLGGGALALAGGIGYYAMKDK